MATTRTSNSNGVERVENQGCYNMKQVIYLVFNSL